MKNNIVRKSNKIIEACYEMETSELRLIYSCISKIDYKQIINADQLFTIPTSEYAAVFGLDVSNARRELKKAVDSLWERSLTINRPNNTPFKTRWISGQAEYRNGGAEIRFAQDIIPYLTSMLELGSFTIYKLEQISQLKNKYSIRLYELLKQYEKIKERVITIEDLRKILSLGTKYKRMRDLKEYVLDKAVGEINESTDISVEYENKKKGKAIFALKFTISKSRKTPKVCAIPVNPKKHLSTSEVYAEFQKPRFKALQNYEQGFLKLEKEGYSFNRASFFAKYNK